jgi:DNA-binding HxlR family transcriptional regulator
VRRTSFAQMNCSIAQTMEVIGDWWTPLIVREALMGTTRFEQFQTRLGIARNVLTDRLTHLTDHGILERTPYQQQPVRHEYRLTEQGRDLWKVIMMLRQWGDTWLAESGPPVQTRHRTCGNVVEARLVCSACDQPLEAPQLRLEVGPGARSDDVLAVRQA